MAITAPSNVVATRTSTTAIKVTWKNGTTASGTVTQIYCSVDGGDYEFRGAPPTPSTSQETGGYPEGHWYRFRLRHYNPSSGEYSSWYYSDEVFDYPNPPTGVSASRVSDTSAKVTWTVGAETEAGPISNTCIERQTDGGSYTQLIQPISSVNTWTDSSISANHRYRYRLRSKNRSGYSGYVQTDYIYTTPATPSSITASKTAANKVTVGGDYSNAPYATGVDIQRKQDGGSWATIASNSSLPYSDTITGETVQYRIRSVRGTLYSAWKTGSTIQGLQPPAAPTITSKPAAVVVSGSSVTVKWSINHPDGSAQSAAQVELTDPNGTVTTQSLTTAKVYSFTPSALGVWSARVRTKGLHQDWGAWSATVDWRMADAPIVIITSPAIDGENVSTMPLTVAWQLTDASGITSVKLEVSEQGGQTLFSRTYSGQPSSVTLPRTALPLENGGSYRIDVTATNGYGLATTATRTFEVDWAEPAIPSLAIEEGDGGSAIVTVGRNRIGSATFAAEGVGGMARSFTVLGSSGIEVLNVPTVVDMGGPSIVIYGKNLLGFEVGKHYGIRVAALEDGGLGVSGTATQDGRVRLASLRHNYELPLSEYAYNVRTEDVSSSTDSFDIGPSGGIYEVESTFSVYLDVVSGQTVSARVYPMLRAASIENAAYEPPIEPTRWRLAMTANLRGLPDGTCDTETLSADGSDIIVRRCGYTTQAATIGVTGTVGVDVLSSTGTIEDGAQVVYKLAEPTTEAGQNQWQDFDIPDTATVCAESGNVDYAHATPTLFETEQGVHEDTPATEAIAVQRVNQDGTVWTVAEGLQSGESAIDPLPPLGVPVTYRIIAEAASGATSYADFTYTVGGSEWALNFGDRAGDAVTMIYNPDASRSLEQGGSLYHFADGGEGGGRPVWYGTTDRDEGGSLSFQDEMHATADELFALCDRFTVGWLRDPFGHRWRARLRPSVKHGIGSVWTLGIDWQAVRFREAW